MGRRTREEQAEYMRNYRADPGVAAVNAWRTRTENKALRELARRHRGEYAAILWDVRQQDPRPEAEESDAA